jgi:hypothetical protein
MSRTNVESAQCDPCIFQASPICDDEQKDALLLGTGLLACFERIHWDRSCKKDPVLSYSAFSISRPRRDEFVRGLLNNHSRVSYAKRKYSLLVANNVEKINDFTASYIRHDRCI